MKTVGVIGGSGYIGSYITKKFLDEGYTVKASITDLRKHKKYQHLQKLKNADNLEIFPMDIMDIDTIKDLVEDCDIVIHGGTPFQLDVKDPTKDLFEPTVKGTEKILEAVHESISVKKVVIIASVAAFNTNFPIPVVGRSPDHIYTESDEPHLNEEAHPYAQAKYYADQIVQKFMKDHIESKVEIVSVYPVFVIGPALSNREDSTSMGLQYLFKNRIAPNPFVQMLFDEDVEFATVDVRDVAESIYVATTKEGLHGKRYYLSNESWKVSDISRMLNKENVTEQPSFVYSGENAKRDLLIKFKPASRSFNDYAEKI